MTRGRGPDSTARTSGFALLDVLLTVVILGILTAVAVRTADTEEWDLDATARAIAADLLGAQALALETGVPLGVQFVKGSNRWSFVLADGKTPLASEAALLASPTLTKSDALRLSVARTRGDTGFGNVSLDPQFAGEDRVVFAADGSTTATGYVQIDRGRSWLRVRIQAATGRVTITAP